MAMAERTADVVWQGSLADGSGTILRTTSGALPELPVTWAARTEAHGGKTSPEELVAAAHASCFSMALSADLAKAGSPPERLDVTANVTLDMVDGAPTVTTSALTVRGRVPGLDVDGFREAARGAGRNCPISRLLKGAEITVDATLER
jgi:osmotically inducible protein OsmC